MALLAITAAIEIGSLIYRLVDRPNTPKPTLASLQMSNAQNGAPIPFGYGTCRFAGQIIWSPGLTFTQNNSKKGGGPVTYSYFASFAVAFGEGPCTIGRIWGDSKLIYDPNPAATSALDVANYPAWDSTITYNPGADVAYAGSVWECIVLNTGQIPNAVGSTYWLQVGDYPNWSPLADYSPGDVVTFADQLWVSMNATNTANPVMPPTSVWSPSNMTGDWVLMNSYYPAPTIYPGTATQDADPLIQAAEGAANTSANRGLCYALFDTFPLQNFGSRIPNIRAEVQFAYTAAASSSFELGPSGGSWGSNSGATAQTSGNVSPSVSVFTNQSILAQARFVSTVTTPTCSDTLGNSYSLLASGNNWAVFFCAASVGTASGPTFGGTYEITVSFGGVSTEFALVASTFPDGVGGTPSVVTTTGNGRFISGVISGIAAGPFQLAPSNVNYTLVLIYFPTGPGTAPDWPNPLYGPAVVAFMPFDNSASFPGGSIAGILGPDGSNHYITGLASYVPGEWTLFAASANDDSRNFASFVLSPTQIPASANPALLPNVVTNICERTGLLSSQIDVSLLTNANIQPNITVEGYLVEQPRSGAEILKVLMQAYFFDGCESGGKMRWIPRGLASVMSIPESDLGLLEDKAKLEESLAQAQDLPQQITVIHDDPVLDYQQNKQLKLRSVQVVGSTKQNITLRIPMTMDASWALQVAEKALYLAWLERSSYKMNLWRAIYMLLDPTDVITFTYETLSFTARVSSNTLGQGFVVEMECVNDNSNSYLSTAQGGTVQGYQTTPSILVGPTQLSLFDIPLIEDTDSNSGGTGFYFGCGSSASDWVGAVLYDSSDNSDFDEVDPDSDNVTFGSATTTLGAPATPWTWDTVNSLTIQLATGILAGDSQLDVLNGSNVLIVGSEIIAFQNAVQNSDGTWTVSTLLRGLRGTEWACGTHGSNELVLLVSSGLQRQAEALAVIGVPEYYKAVTIGQDITTAGSREFTIEGADLKPYAPAGIGGTVDGSGNITVTWIRRTRIGGEADWADGVADVPLSEDAELYDVDVLNGSTVVRTFTGLTSAACVYSAADQTADFGSTQASVTFNVYQKSAQVGRGYKSSGVAPSPGGWPIPWPAVAGSSGGVGSFYVNGS